MDAAEEKRREFALPGTESMLRGRSGTPGSFSRSSTIEPLTAVPRYLSSNSSNSSRSSTPSPFPSTSANALASTSAKTPPAAAVHNSFSSNEFDLEYDMDLGNDPEDVVFFGGGDDKESSDSSGSDSESESLPEEKSKKVPSSKTKRRESWDNGEPLTPEERKRIEALGSSYEKACEMNIKYKDRKMAESGLQDAAREFQSLLRLKPKLQAASRKPKNTAALVDAGQPRRSSRLSINK